MGKKAKITDEHREEAARLKALFNERSTLSQQAFGLEFEIGSQGMVWQYLNATSALNTDAALKFARGLGCSVADFSPRLAALLLPSPRPLTVEEPLSAYNVVPAPERPGLVPLISWVRAGDLCESPDNYSPGDAEEWLPCPIPYGPNTFALRVVGDSMLPEYRDGEIIYVDPAREAKHADDVVARTPDGASTFKRLQKTPDGTFLLALNPDYPERIIKVPMDTHICGVVIGSWMDRRR